MSQDIITATGVIFHFIEHDTHDNSTFIYWPIFSTYSDKQQKNT